MVAGALVYFDIETTSLRKDCEITQIAAVWRHRCFNAYIMPEGNISYGASQVTGIEKDEDSDGYEELFVGGECVEAASAYDGLSDFVDWLNDLEIKCNNGYPILVGHNAHQFDIPRLLYNAEVCELDEALLGSVAGYIDTLQLFKSAFPDFNRFNLEALLDTWDMESYDAHNALEDARALRALMSRTELFRDTDLLFQHFYSL